MGYDSLVDSPQPYGDHLKRRKPAAPLESGHAFDDELASHSHVGRCLAGRGRKGVVGRALGLCPLGVVDACQTRGVQSSLHAHNIMASRSQVGCSLNPRENEVLSL